MSGPLPLIQMPAEVGHIAPGTILKAITLHQPWASFMALNLKKNETRGKPWSYLGRVAIASAKSEPREYREMMVDPSLPYRSIFRTLLRKCGAAATDENILHTFLGMPRGEVVCLVDKVGCVRSEDIRDSVEILEAALGNYDDGRFIYVTTNLVVLPPGIPATGAKQGVWNWVVPDLRELGL